MVHGGDLKHDSQVSSGVDGDGDGGDVDAQDVDSLVIQTETVVHLFGIPGLQVDHQVNSLGFLDRAHTEESAHVHDTDAAKLDIITDQLGGGTHQGLGGNPSDLHGVVGDESVSSLDQLNGGLALTDAAVAKDQHTLSVDLHKHAVAGDTGSEVGVQIGNDRRHECAGALLGAKQGDGVLLGKGHHFIKAGQIGGQNQCHGLQTEEALQSFDSLLVGKLGKILMLHASDQLDSVGLKHFRKARNRQSRSVQLGAADLDIFPVLGQGDDLQLKLTDDLTQRNGIIRLHSNFSFCRNYLIIPCFPPKWKGFFDFSFMIMRFSLPNP